MNDTSQFTYILENLDYTPSLVIAIVSLFIACVSIFLMRYIFLYSYGFLIVRSDAAIIEKKKRTLSDLILMKDIQTELEKEIEKAMLKATFHG